jgi:hypothetical protein
MNGFRIVLYNRSGCELHNQFVQHEDDIKESLLKFVQECDFSPGDMIRVLESWSEV